MATARLDQHDLLIERYRLAFSLGGHGLGGLVRNLMVSPHWIDGSDAFWYRSETDEGHRFVRVDPARGGAKEAVFDHERIAALLAAATGEAIDPEALPFDRFEYDAWEDGRPELAAIRVEREGVTWACDLAAERCVPTTRMLPPTYPGTEGDSEMGGVLWGTTVPSPDGRFRVMRRDHNLYLETVATGEVRTLTRDGTARHGYAEVTATVWDGEVSMPRYGKEWPAQILWSPDSRSFLTVRVDVRDVEDLYLIDVAPDGRYDRRPTLHPYPNVQSGDPGITKVSLIIFEAETGRRIDVQMAPLLGYAAVIQHKEAWWSADGTKLFVGWHDRDGRRVWLIVVDAATGAARELVSETGTPYLIDPSVDPYALHLPQDDTLLWWSARDGWGHLYRYDMATSNLLNQVTHGEWNVAAVLRSDDEGWVYFTARGREPGRDLYYCHLYRIKPDGSALTLLTPEDAEHEVAFSPSGSVFVDRYSRVDLPTVSVLRAADGTLLAELETADVGRLEALGWSMPERWRELGADDETELFGVLYRPWGFDAARSYPVVEYVYGLPQSIVGPRSFASALDAGQLGGSLPALGFAVIMTDGRGTPGRSRAFRHAGEGVLDCSGQVDHVAAITRLGARYPFLDLERVGITGFSGGGYGSTRAICRYPDFYKVAVSGAGSHNHWQTGYSDGETSLGLPETNPEGWVAQSNTSLAANLRGKLLLIHGGMDDDTPPANSLQVADALIQAGKAFDFLIVPRANHGRLWRDPYYWRLTWDYFVRHLLGEEPPDWNAIDYRDLLAPEDSMEVVKST